MRKLVFAITKQCDDQISEKAYRLDNIIFFTSSIISLILWILTITLILADSMNLACMFTVIALVSSSVTLIRMTESASLSTNQMLRELRYETISESEDREILYNRANDSDRGIDIHLELVKGDFTYWSEKEYETQTVLDNLKSSEFAYLVYKFDDKTVFHSRTPIYLNQIQIDSSKSLDLHNRFAKLKISRIEQFDAKVKLSFEGREKTKNVKMINVFFEVINADEYETKQSIYEEIVERSK